MFDRYAAALTAGLILSIASGQTHAAYPSSPIRLIIGQSAGSSVDAVARIMGERMAKSLGQSVVVENMPGANGITATAYVARAKPDGYTLLFSGCSPMVFNPGLYKQLPYDPIKDFTYVAAVSENPFVMVASKVSRLKSFADLEKVAKANPGKLTFASAGIGNSTQLATELVSRRAGLKLLHIPFNGSGPALVSVIGGQVDLMSSVVGPAMPELKAGAVTPLLIIGGGPIPELPGVPSAKEVGLNLPPLPTWTAVVGPAGMDPAVRTRLEQAVQEALRDPEVLKQFKAQYLSTMNVPGQQMAARVAAEMDVWKKLLHDFGFQPE